MKWILVVLAACGVGIAAAWALWPEEGWEAILTGVFCTLPVFFLGAWLAGRTDA